MSGQLAWSALQPFGAKVDLDLSGNVSDAQCDELRRLFNEHHLLYLADQSLSESDQARISSWFGPVSDRALSVFDNADPDVGMLADAELAFHSDLSCAPEPVIGLSLFGVNVGAGASPTRFIDAMAPARALEPGLRRRLEGLHTMNLWPIKLGVRQRAANSPDNWPGTAHPVLKPHPRTGLPIIYVNASHTDRIIELSDSDSEALINELFGCLYAESNVYEHHWRNGDFVVWDNLALQHARPESPSHVPRKLQRAEIGTADYRSQMPPELIAAYANSQELG